MTFKFWRKAEDETPVAPVEPSDEAKAANVEAKQIRERADKVYSVRAELLERNHFAERIRLTYQGY